jgi:hypothetical protein
LTYYNRYMNRSLILAGAISLGAAALLGTQTQTPLDADDESHHHLILKNDLVRVSGVSIPAGEEVYVRHRHNFLTVSLEGSRMVMWTEGTSPGLVFPINAGDTRFFLGGAALGMRNDSKATYENITVEFLDPQVTNYGFQYYRAAGQQWDYGSSALAPPPDAQSGFVHALSLQRAVVKDVRLLPGAQLAPPDRAGKELLIAVSDLNLASAGRGEMRKLPGEIAWLDGRSAELVNRGTAPARFVVVELGVREIRKGTF